MAFDTIGLVVRAYSGRLECKFSHASIGQGMVLTGH
jgi:hypothetical protein